MAPPEHKAVACVDRGVGRGADAAEAGVGLQQVQDAVQPDPVVGFGRASVIQDLFGHAVPLGAGAPDVPDQLLLLGVDVPDRRARSLALCMQAGAGQELVAPGNGRCMRVACG